MRSVLHSLRCMLLFFCLCMVSGFGGWEPSGSSIIETGATDIFLASHSYHGSCENLPKCEYLCLALRDVNKRYNECRGHKTKSACAMLGAERMRSYYTFIGCAMYNYPRFRLK